MRTHTPSLIRRCALLTSTLFALCAPHLVAAEHLQALAVMVPTANSTVRGTIEFRTGFGADEGEGTRIRVDLRGLERYGRYGLHVHAFGRTHPFITSFSTQDISDPAAANQFGHYNPTNQPHGCPTFEDSDDDHYIHVGDLGTIEADGNGEISNVVIGHSYVVSVDPLDPGFVVGRGVVLHAQRDDCVSQPSGDSGARLSQGVIGWASNKTALIALRSSTTSTFNNLAVDDSNIDQMHAVAVLSPTNTSVTGAVYFSQHGPNGDVKVRGRISGLAPNSMHALHVHESGDVSSPDASAVGAHFNPGQDEHGCLGTGEHHAGDFGNIKADGQGVADFEINLVAPSGPGGYNKTGNEKRLTLYRSDGNMKGRSLFFALGRSLIIHSGPDDCKTPAAAGYRMAQAVIGYRNATVAVPLPALTPNAKRPDDQGNGSLRALSAPFSMGFVLAGLLFQFVFSAI
ncbi:hypothetical protein HK102_006980 [Quaeritorhiza haematococci]|nr:hypothetical protein HK102_006980 [Quaeritorhiza haematococci]